jgi:DUF4097 and DUF4098 domain-containing protein YvlB
MAILPPLLAACGDDVTIGGGANWPWPWPVNAGVFVQKMFSQDVTVAAHTGVRIEAVNGEVAVTGQPGATTVSVSATLKVGSDTLADAQNGLALLDVQVTDATSEVVVQTMQPANPMGRQYLVEYDVTIPPGLAVDVGQANGHVNITAVSGAVAADLGNGNVLLTDLTGDVTAHSGNGGVDAMLSPPGGATVELSTGNGGIDLRIPAATSAALSANVGVGTITWSGLTFAGLVYTGGTLSGTLGTGTGTIDLNTGVGSIDIMGF